ncbi:MAG: site-specific DNA-methyltransferase, partial [Cyanobacteria bacterium J06636_16]
QFVAWLEAEFEWTPRTAYNFINVFETFRDFEKFSKIDAAASALYLLAAPSTPQEVRDEFLQRALSGEKITHKNVQKTIKVVKQADISVRDQNKPPPPVKAKPEIVRLMTKNGLTEGSQALKQLPSSRSVSVYIQPGWYLIEDKHHLFCGDTASSLFVECIPQAALALAITSDDWDHDWLIDQANNILILEESVVDQKILEQLLSMLSVPGETVVFPYLPMKELLTVGHKLKRKLYLGDSDPQRCTQVLQHSGLRVQRFNPPIDITQLPDSLAN